MHRKKLIAREWLLFICSLVFGFTLFPAFLSIITGGKFSGFYKELFSDDWPFMVVFAFIPYLLIQIVRSIIWAVKILKQRI